MKSLEAQSEEILVTEAEGAGEQAADFRLVPSIFPLVSPVFDLLE